MEKYSNLKKCICFNYGLDILPCWTIKKIYYFDLNKTRHDDEKFLQLLGYKQSKQEKNNKITYTNKHTEQKIVYFYDASYTHEKVKDWDGLFIFKNYPDIPLEIIHLTVKRPSILLESKELVDDFVSRILFVKKVILDFCYNINTSKVSVFDSFHLVKEKANFKDFVSLISYTNPEFYIPL
jgi:hypothetical protein